MSLSFPTLVGRTPNLRRPVRCLRRICRLCTSLRWNLSTRDTFSLPTRARLSVNVGPRSRLRSPRIRMRIWRRRMRRRGRTSRCAAARPRTKQSRATNFAGEVPRPASIDHGTNCSDALRVRHLPLLPTTPGRTTMGIRRSVGGISGGTLTPSARDLAVDPGTTSPSSRLPPSSPDPRPYPLLITGRIMAFRRGAIISSEGIRSIRRGRARFLRQWRGGVGGGRRGSCRCWMAVSRSKRFGRSICVGVFRGRSCESHARWWRCRWDVAC